MAELFTPKRLQSFPVHSLIAGMSVNSLRKEQKMPNRTKKRTNRTKISPDRTKKWRNRTLFLLNRTKIAVLIKSVRLKKTPHFKVKKSYIKRFLLSCT
ncbi:hypothetical protein UN64_11700 [Fictibacillus arsenicus]|uniref:Uncharacterized protein n=1 Tax=Fictibacillus arsenicus TaxID=255247 RepID=A0A1V3G8I4_9BACL|nr:hypothetical protein UN64_11700 [Fictibacillus arsenicus]